MTWMLLLAILLGPGTTHNDNSQPHQIHREAKANSNPVAPVAIIKGAKETPPASNNTYYEHEQPHPKWSDPQWWSVVVNGILAVATFATLLFLRSQVKAIRNIERAFLIPIWERWPRRIGASHVFEWKFKNCGKTPAFINEVVGHLILIDSLDQLPRNPDYSGAVVFKGDPIVPQQEMDRNFFSEMRDDRDFNVIEDEYRSGKKILYAYGSVRYLDMFGKKHQTRFGVRFTGGEHFSHEDEFVVDGPKSYNSYT